MGRLGIEPRTYQLKADYSTVELATRVYHFLFLYIIKENYLSYQDGNVFLFFHEKEQKKKNLRKSTEGMKKSKMSVVNHEKEEKFISK